MNVITDVSVPLTGPVDARRLECRRDRDRDVEIEIECVIQSAP